jgi:predicted DsbA family dithiol-disulfide isomerase
MRVDIWSDIACPFCYIGKRNFETALAQFTHKDRVQVVMHSFELDPQAPKNQNISMDQMLAKKYNMTVEKARSMNESVTERAAQAGIHFDLEAAILTNHFDGHRLLHLAKERGVQPLMAEKLFAAYFSEGKDVSNHHELIQLGAEAGLKPAEVKEMLESEMYTAEVREDEAIANELGISGVPAFILAEKYLISGAQPVETFVEALNAAWREKELA